jgi:soluble P-type ATPase
VSRTGSAPGGYVFADPHNPGSNFSRRQCNYNPGVKLPGGYRGRHRRPDWGRVMINIEVPGRGMLGFEHLVLDLNGTLATDGIVSEPVAGRLRELLSRVQVHLVTADTFGTASALEALGLHILILGPGDQVEAKAVFVRKLGASRTVAIGNGMNDEGMLREAALGIVVVGREGAAARALLAADLVVPSIEDGLDLLRFPRRLVASLRTA